jgi:hypothetical protein
VPALDRALDRVDLLGVRRQPHRHRGPGQIAGRTLDLDEGPLDRVPGAGAGRLRQHPQRHHQRQRLVGIEPQRPVDAGVVGDRHPVAVERHVDQVARAVSRQAADPEQFQVLAQLPRRDPEVGGRLGDQDPGPGQQVRDEIEQPAQAVGRGPVLAAARRRRHGATAAARSWRATTSLSCWITASRSSGGPSARTSAP